MAITTVEVNGVQKDFQLGSLSWDDSAKSVGGASCTFITALTGGSAYVPLHGQSFEVKIGGNIKFGGEVTDISEKYLIDNVGTAVTISVKSYGMYLDDSIVDFEIADGAYTEKSLITFLVSNYLGPDYGIVADAGMTNGITLPALQFRNVSARSVLQTLTTLSGRVYRLTPAKLLMTALDSSGFALSELSASVLPNTIVTQISPAGNYYNSVVVTGDFLGTENITGNGSLAQWGLSYDPVLDSSGWIVGTGGVVNEAGANYPLGLFGVDALLWTFDPATSILHRSSPLGNGVAVIFNYSVNAVSYEDTAEVTAHKRRKKTFTMDTPTTADSAFDGAVALVRIGITGDAKRVTVQTRQTSMCFASQTLTLNFPSRNVPNGTYLIESVRASFPEDESSTQVQTLELTCREGTELGSEWQDFFKEASGGGGGGSQSVSVTTGSGGGNISGTGTVGKLAKFVASDTIGDSIITESGSALSIAGNVTLTGTFALVTSGRNVFTAQDADDTPVFLKSTTTSGIVGLQWQNSDASETFDIVANFSANTLTFKSQLGSLVTITAAGVVTFATTASTAWLFNSTHTDGGYITVQRSGSDVGYLGTAKSAVSSSLAATDLGLRSNTLLYLYGPTGIIVYSSPLRSETYVSQTTGWGIDTLGGADFRYLFVDEMHAKSFIADLEQALAGGQIIAKSVAMVSQAFTAPAAGGTATLWVRDLPSASNMAAFESGDAVVLRTFSRASGALTIADCVGVVTSYADGTGGNEGQQSWTFTRGSGGNSGTMSTSTVVAVDSLALDYGVTGNGYWEVNAIDGTYGVNSPYAQVVTWATSPVAANKTTRMRIGNLKGIVGSLQYGMIVGKDFSANQYLLASDTTFQLRGIELMMFDGATNTIKMDPTVPSFALGATLPSAYGTGTGIWMGKDTAYKFRVGNPSGNRVAWDGTDLTVVATNLTINNLGITFTTIGNSISQDYGYRFTSAMAGTNFTGMFATEPDSINRTVKIFASTNQSSKTIQAVLEAASGSVLANVVCLSDGSTSSVTLTGTEFFFGTTVKIDSNGDLIPVTDNSDNCGVGARRWALVRGTTITPGDLSFDNGWTITESDKIGIVEPGLAFLDELGDLVAFLSRGGFRFLKTNEDVDDLLYVKTTAEERSEMDRVPFEGRVRKEGTTIRPFPSPSNGVSNRSRGIR